MTQEVHGHLAGLEGGRLIEEEVESTMRRLMEMASWGDIADILGSEACLRGVIKMMRRWPLNESIQVSGCHILGAVASRGEEPCKLICRLGGVGPVVDALRNHPEAADAQEKGCWAVRQLATESRCRREAGALRGPAAVVEALENNTNAIAILENGCMALANLSVDAEIRTSVTQAGGVEALVESMSHNIDSATLQEAACFALHNIACTNEYQQAIAQSGGIRATVEAMQAHPNHAGVQESGCSVFHNVASGPMECLEAVSRGGVVEAVVQAMQAHPTHAGVQEKAAHAIGQVGDVRRRVIELEDRALRDKIVALGGANALRQAAKHFKRDLAVSKEAEEALSILEVGQ